MSEKQKQPVVELGGQKFLRLPIKTPVIAAKDDIVELATRCTEGVRQPGDIIVVSESVVAISQGRAIPEDQIRIGLLAKLLWRFVRKVPYGTGLRRPSSMQCAINECGALRILTAAVVGGFTRLLGRRGDFYRIAGMQAATIDAAHTAVIPPYDQCVILGPKDPDKVAEKIKAQTGCEAAIMDVNDIGGSWALGATSGVDKKLIEDIMRDNPLGQSDECTPLGLLRPLT